MPGVPAAPAVFHAGARECSWGGGRGAPFLTGLPHTQYFAASLRAFRKTCLPAANETLESPIPTWHLLSPDALSSDSASSRRRGSGSRGQAGTRLPTCSWTEGRGTFNTSAVVLAQWRLSGLQWSPSKSISCRGDLKGDTSVRRVGKVAMLHVGEARLPLLLSVI